MDSGPQKSIVVLGDSTIDNRVWLGMEKYHLFLGQNHILSKALHFISWFNPFKPKSVIENLRQQMPHFEFIDRTNDGFTTKDLLNGAYRDKVFGQGAHRFFPHEYFTPLATKEIEHADSIILSIGGNNFREFIQTALSITDESRRKRFIEDEYPTVFKEMQEDYQKILKEIIARNPNAHLILMTQYYPSLCQKTLLNKNIYDFMTELGTIFNKGNAQEMIVEVMKDCYSGIFKFLAQDAQMRHAKISVVDVTSSLNPNFPENHAGQIEPSNLGGKRIAQMLLHTIERGTEALGKIYRFAPGFFSQSPQMRSTPHVHSCEINASFTPVSPNAMLKPEFNWKKFALICTTAATMVGGYVFLLGGLIATLPLSILAFIGLLIGYNIASQFSIGLPVSNDEIYTFKTADSITTPSALPRMDTPNATPNLDSAKAQRKWTPYLRTKTVSHLSEDLVIDSAQKLQAPLSVRTTMR